MCKKGRVVRLVFIITLVAGAAGPVDGSDPEARGPLDGMVFRGEFGPADAPADRMDRLHFNEGKFWSGNCVPCGFPPGAYWVRRVRETIHFRGTMHSAESGTFTYRGRVEDGRISATIHWRKERWYWTIERAFHFQGHAVQHDHRVSPATVRDKALAAKPLPETDCEP